MKTYPAPTTSQQVPDDGSALRDVAFCQMVICVLMMKNHSPYVAITQEDMDAASLFTLMEGRDENGNFLIGLGVRQEETPQ